MPDSSTSSMSFLILRKSNGDPHHGAGASYEEYRAICEFPCNLAEVTRNFDDFHSLLVAQHRLQMRRKSLRIDVSLNPNFA